MRVLAVPISFPLSFALDFYKCAETTGPLQSRGQVQMCGRALASVEILILLCCSALVLAEAVRIGAITDPSSHIGREQKIAMEIAAQEFNTSISNALFLNTSDSSSEVESLISEWGANAIISTGPWADTVQIARIGNRKRVPILSLAPSQPPAIAHNPFLFRMSYSAPALTQCLADLVKLYNWRQVIVLYEDDDYGTTSAGLIPPLNDALRDTGTEIIRNVAFPPSSSKALVRWELERLKKTQFCKVFIVARWASPSLATHLFREAESLGMMTKGHAWVAGDDITALLDSTFTPSFVSSYMQGVIGITTYVNQSSASYRDFRAKFRQRSQAEPGAHAARAYDAVHVIARARDIRGGSIVGLSGPIQFGRDGGLAEGTGSSAFRVINVVGRSYREMGFWREGSGFCTDESEMGEGRPSVGSVLGTAYWPGGATEKPPGGWGRLRIGVPAKTVFDMFVKVKRDVDGEVKDVTGFCIEVYKEAVRRLKYELDYDFLPFSGSYDGLVGGIPERYDGVVGDVTILIKRMKNATFTKPYLPSGLSTLVPLKPQSTGGMLTRPFTNQVWLLGIASYFYTCAVVWYLERNDNPEFQGAWTTQLGATLWLMLTTIFFAQGPVYNYYTRIVIAVWLIVLLLLTFCYTASLGSILTTQKLEPIISDQSVGCNRDSFVVDYLQQVLGYKDEQIQRIEHVENYTMSFESGSITKAYLETPYLRIFLSKYEGYTAYGDTQQLGGFGFVFRKDSPLAADFSEAILELSEDGTLKQLEDKWFSLSLETCPTTAKDRTRESLGLDSVWALFFFTAAASTLTLILFKANCTPHNSCRSLERCAGSCRNRLVSTRTELQNSRSPPPSPVVVAGPHGHGEGGDGDQAGNLPNQNNV